MGIDIGSTTIKIIIINEEGSILFKDYRRHLSDIKNTLLTSLSSTQDILKDQAFAITITGSGGMLISTYLKVPFIQEVICSSLAIQEHHPQTDVVLELGGEDAKITYLTGGIEQRMNGTCAGGTGSFIDQMATLLSTDATGLNHLAKTYHNIYPIAARCGVFAKTDIQPLINEGARREDIAISIFHAVVVQTISVLACGRPIQGHVAFLGGPLTFLSELRKHFIETLDLSPDEVVFPKNSHLYTALGAALASKENQTTTYDSLSNQLLNFTPQTSQKQNLLEPLFTTKEDYATFTTRHGRNKVKEKSIEETIGPCFLGIDAGSTTTKAALIDQDGNLLYSYYKSNKGDPIQCGKDLLRQIYEQLPPDATIAHSVVTGYGESLFKAAFKVDQGEIETIAHFKGAQFFCPNVDFILDIGGQDMKCLRIKDGAIQDILLNEACSSGCGSFLETFADSIGMDIITFSQKSLYAQSPVDLGTRCTVFMNSKVKQAQRDGALVEDIAAGLCYSVIKNTLYKVIKIRTPEALGSQIVVQGGTFNNDAVLRCFEKLTGRKAIRPNISGIMGAFGASLIAKERYRDGQLSTILSLTEMEQIELNTKTLRCRRCSNNCLLTVNNFGNGEKYISGNRCERGLGVEIAKNPLPNIYDYKYERLFNYKPIKPEDAPRGVIGLPRVLNMYENYPFWFRFFTNLGFSVQLSRESSKSIYEKGIDSIASESVCFPAKIVHGHIMDLLSRNIKNIFYPCITHEIKEDPQAGNCYNCPVVTSYSELIKNNIPRLKDADICYLNPFLPYHNKKRLKETLVTALSFFNISKPEISQAVDQAILEQDKYKSDVQNKGEEILEFIEKHELNAIVLGGRPYHIDPEINHGIPKLITTLGLVVLSEDAVAHLADLKRPLRVHDQWTYHTRLYAAASYVASRNDLDFIHLNSFGCGLDAISSDQIAEILRNSSKIYTCIKIDEGSNLGSAKIRIRSLKALIQERMNSRQDHAPVDYTYIKPVPSKKSLKSHTIIAPQFSPIHFDILAPIFNAHGYQVIILKDYEHILEEGLKYANNDICYPAIVVIGQIIKCLKSGQYDPENTSVMIAQTGGGCRFTNYTASLRKAMTEAGYGEIPVIPINGSGLEKENNLNFTPRLVAHLTLGVLYGDLLMKALYRIRPYEKEQGRTETLYRYWVTKCIDASVKHIGLAHFKKITAAIVQDFEQIDIYECQKPRVGLVGELLVKFHPAANNSLVKTLENEGCEVLMNDFANLFLSSAYSMIYRCDHLAEPAYKKPVAKIAIKLIERYQQVINLHLSRSSRFWPSKHIGELAALSKNILQLGNQTGEGWIMSGEIIELMEQGAVNIIIMQPFGCLPGHITGKGIMKELKRLYPQLNIVAIDFDPGASEVNQLNRIKLMLNNAFEKK